MIIVFSILNSHLQMKRKHQDFQIPHNSIGTNSYIKPSDLHDKNKSHGKLLKRDSLSIFLSPHFR